MQKGESREAVWKNSTEGRVWNNWKREEEIGGGRGRERNNSQGDWGVKKSERRGKASEHCTACHWPPGVNNPSQIDLPARPSRAFWINLKLISVPEVGKTSSGAYQKYSGAGRIWQGNLSHCTTGNGLWAPGAARGRACSLYTHTHTHTHAHTIHTHSFNVSPCTQHNHTLTHAPQCSAQYREAALCIDTLTNTFTHTLRRRQNAPTGYVKKF